MLSVRNRLFLLVVLPFFLTLFPGVAAAQQCTNCTPISIPDTQVSGDPTGGGRDTYDVNSTPSMYTGSSGQSEQPGYINVVITPSGTTPLPANLPAGTYPAWCGTSPSDGNGAQNYVATTASNPYSATQWNEINYILNNKQGYVIDVQVAIWGVLGTIAESDMVAAGYTTAAAIYNAAVANGQNFIPAPGQHTAVILLSQHRSGSAVWQHLIVEMINCGSIGEVFWNDSTNNNGILPFTTVNGTTTAAEPGINGITVNLLDANNNVIATTVTAPSPIQYPYLPPDTNGWYQFTGLCPGTYSVSFEANQTALAGLVLETPVTNQIFPVVYNNSNPVVVTLSPTLNPIVNEANNFGFNGYSPLNVMCAAMGGAVNSPYASQMVVTGGVSPYTYSLASGNLPPGLSLNASTGTITGTPTTAGTYTFSIQVKDSSNLAAGTTTSNCTITIAPPPITLQCAGGSAVVGQAYSSSLQAAGGTGGYTFTIVTGSLPGGLTLNASTGAITGTPTAAGTFAFTAKVVDSAGDSGNSGTVNCSITVVVAPTVTCATITAVQGVAITQVTLAATGGAGGPYTYTVTGLPAGLSLSASGAISGTATASGTYNYTITVKDGSGNTGTVNCSVTVVLPVTATCVGITTLQWTAIAPVTMLASGGSGSGYTFAASGLPAGLTMSSTGTISGTPVVTGAFAYTVTVTDGAGNTGTVNCSVTVALPITATCLSIVAVQGLPILNVTMLASGGAGGPYTFAATGLPAGLTMALNGLISGIPTVTGTFSYTVTIKDAAGNTGTVNCYLNLSLPVSATCASISAIQGVAIAPATMTATGGSGTGYTFTAANLPAGLVMSSGGTISGTPTVSGTFAYVVTVKDSNGATGTVNCSVTIAPPVSATCVSITAVQGVAITPVTMVATGGTGAGYTFSASGLPAGLVMSSGGTISGTPTTAGTFNYTVTVTDGGGHTGTANCSVTVSAPVSATCAAITAIQGVAITPVTMVGSGGAGSGYTFTATGLPAGVTIASGGTISGTPTVSGTFNYTVTVTDGGGHTGTVNCSVTVSAPVSATCAAITAVQGVAITPVTMVGSGGTGSGYIFAATGLPAGVTIASGGTISGTPTVSGTFNYSVTVTDGGGHTGTVNCSVTVSAPVSATCVAIAAVQGVAITPVTMVGSGGSGSGYTFAATGLPAGVTIASGGTISGTPTVGGTFNYTVTVTDGGGHTGTVNCSVTVSAAVSATCASITAIQGVAISPATMTASGGTGSGYTFTATGLPAGVTIASGGTISGTPTVSGTFNYTVTVTDGGGHTGTVNCSVTVSAAVSATCVSISALQGVAITPVTMVATGGTGAGYTFSARGLPAGLVISSGGTISGTPTVSGTFAYTVTVTDGGGHTGTVNCSVTVAPAVSANCVTITAVQGVAITPVTTVATGGTGTGYTFTPSGLPTGVTMSSSGTISGTPTVSGGFSYTVTVTDSAGHTGTMNCSVTVVQAVQLTCAVITATQGTAITPTQVVATGGTGTGYTFSATGLPAGVTISNSGLISGTPTVSGTFSYTVTVTDSAGHTGTANCSMAPKQNPVGENCVTITATQGVAITPVTMTAAGGSGTGYTFSASGLPGGLSMATGGTISGTPTVSGTFSYTVTVKDSAGDAGTANCSVTVGTPVTAQIAVAKTADAATVPAGSVAGFTVTISNTGSGPATGVTLSDPLPAGAGADINWKIDPTTGNPGSFAISGGVGSQVLTLNASTNLAAGSSLKVHITGTTNTTDAPGSSNPALNVSGLSGYTVLYEGTGSNQLSVSNDTIVGNVGLTGGQVQFSGPGTIAGRVDFSGAYAGQYHSTNGSNVGPTSVNYNVSAVTAAANAINSLSAALGGLTGTNISFNNSSTTINESAGALQTAGGVTYRVFNVTSYSENNANTVTVNGDGSGDPVVFNFTYNSNTNLGGQVVLTGGLTPDQVIWNFTSSNKQVQLNNNGGAFQGVLILPDDQYQSDNSNLTGRVYGGAAGNMQIVSGANVSEPPTTGSLVNTATVNATNVSGSVQATATVIVTYSSNGQVTTQALMITCPTATGTTGLAYSSGAVAAGGLPPYTFSVVAGSLPPGLTLNALTGAITGTPTTAASYSFTIKVMDSTGNSSVSSCSQAYSTGQWSFNSQTGSLGNSWGYSFNGIPVTAYGYSSNGSGAGLCGQNNGGSSYGLGIQGTSGNYIDTNHWVTLDISQAIAAGVTGGQIVMGGLGYGEGYAIYGSNTLGQLGTQLYNGTSNDNGNPVNIPNCGQYKYISVKATSGNCLISGVSFTTTACQITIAAPPISLSCAAGTASEGVAYSSGVTVTGGTGPYTFSIASGSLPNGLTLIASTGAITGTPAVSRKLRIHGEGEGGFQGQHGDPVELRHHGSGAADAEHRLPDGYGDDRRGVFFGCDSGGRRSAVHVLDRGGLVASGADAECVDRGDHWDADHGRQLQLQHQGDGFVRRDASFLLLAGL